MPYHTIDLLEQSLAQKQKPIIGSRIALLGLASAHESAGQNGSSTLLIKQELNRRGAIVRTFDPFLFSESNTHSIDDVLHNADAALITSDHTLFRELTAKEFAIHNVDIVIDRQNCLTKENFTNTTITYHDLDQ